MSTPLIEALEHVELTPGTYCCHVKGHWVEVRVRKEQPLLAKPFDESDVMLDPWFELPGLNAVGRCEVKAGIELTVDPPDVPSEWAGD
ncbi:MAG TPA: hypothetical protein VNH11_03945 [Pirellulales bacterium]|nr:hypothetical protein [Pirellulales bacterium]